MRGTKRQTDRKFAATAHDGSRNHPEQTHRDEEQRTECEAANQHRADALLAQRVDIDAILTAMALGETAWYRSAEVSL